MPAGPGPAHLLALMSFGRMRLTTPQSDASIRHYTRCIPLWLTSTQLPGANAQHGSRSSLLDWR